MVSDPFGSSLCLIFVGLFFTRHLYNHRMLTIGDFFREKYGRTVEVLVSLYCGFLLGLGRCAN